MSDRELLEAAAKAAGFGDKQGRTIWTESEYPPKSGAHGALWNFRGHMDTAELWNPLTSDGDALRLAVALRLTVAVRFNECEVFEADFGECVASEPIFTASAFISAEQATDPAVATRRAIVRAAAAIGGAK